MHNSYTTSTFFFGRRYLERTNQFDLRRKSSWFCFSVWHFVFTVLMNSAVLISLKPIAELPRKGWPFLFLSPSDPLMRILRLEFANTTRKPNAQLQIIHKVVYICTAVYETSFLIFIFNTFYFKSI